MCKTCTKCKIKKSIDDFHLRSERPSGVRSRCKDCCNLYRRRHYLSNKNKVKRQNREYYYLNKKTILAQQRNYEQKKYREDQNFRIAFNLRHRLCHAVKSNSKKGSAIQDLGCSIAEFKLYIENYFSLYLGMRWENYGVEWEFDHFVPLSSFDLSDRIQLQEACSWINIQPLWIADNRRKGNKIHGVYL